MKKLIDYDFAAYDSANEDVILGKWETIFKRIDEYLRFQVSDDWHKEDKNRTSSLIENAEFFIGACIRSLLEDCESNRNSQKVLDKRCALSKIYSQKLILRYNTVQIPDFSPSPTICDDDDWPIYLTHKVNFPEVAPEAFRRFVSATSALELREDAAFAALVDEITNPQSSDYGLFTYYDFMRLREYDDRSQLAEKIERLFRLLAVKAKSISRIDLAERLIEDARAANDLKYRIEPGDAGFEAKIHKVSNGLVEDYNALMRAIDVDNLPAWSEVKEASEENC